MKRLSVYFVCVIVTLAGSRLMAQVPDTSHMYVRPPIRISDRPQNPGAPTGIFPAAFKAAYGFNRVPNQGQGQTIAIVDAYDDPNIEADVAVYTAQFHLSACNFQKVKVGNPGPSEIWALEISLDIQQACALVPQANIILIEANSQTLADLLAAVQVAYSAPINATVISMSWGYPEFSGESANDSIFCNILNDNGQPVTFVAASGDRGHATTIYPGASPCVVSAGGTTLDLTSALPPPNPLQIAYGIEEAWIDSSGGVSPYEAQPSYQASACATWSTTNRCIPDIASVSDNIPVYDTYIFNGWQNVSGTSIASPDWASFLTMVNSLRARQGKGLLSQAAQDLYAAYYSSNYSTDFHDITTGNNGNCGSQCNAVTGYDLVTGIGTYQANNIYSVLVADPN